MNLTKKQKDELHKAMLGYMLQAGLTKTLDAFSLESKCAEEPANYKDKLERKWRSILRLEKKIQELSDETRDIQDKMQTIGEEGVVNETEALPEMEKHTLNGHRGPVTCVCFHPRFNVLVSGSDDTDIMVWDAEEGQYQKKLHGHTETVEALAFNPSGTLLASCGADTTVRLWDFGKDMGGTMECVKTIQGHDHTVSALCWTSSGEFLFSASRDKSIKQWELSTGHCKKTYGGGDASSDSHTEWVKHIKLSPDESQICSGSYDHSLKVWDVDTTNCLTTFMDHDHDITAVDFSSAKSDQFIIDYVLDEDDQKVARAEHKRRRDDLEGKEDKGGMFVLSSSRDKTIRLWFVSMGVCVKTFKGHEGWVRDVQFHPSGRYFLSCADDFSIRAWDLKKNGRNCLNLKEAHGSFVQCIDYCRHSPLMASGGVKNTVKLWECS